MIPVLITALTSYLMGSIPFSYIAGKTYGNIDLREHGSGNLGASNAFRLLGPKAASLVLLGDVAKGFLPVHFAYIANVQGQFAVSVHWLMLVAAFFTVLGHMFSIFLRFTGGKGIATSAGAFLALAPWAFLGAFLVWGILFSCTRIVSLGSIFAAISLPVFVYLTSRANLGNPHWSVLLLACIITIVVLVKHKSNISRLLSGKEPALTRKRE